jgi:TRAP-type C4-dicarboxylate transport system permease large subunit
MSTAFGDFSQIGFIALMFFIYLIMGMFLDSIGMLLLTVPVLFPVLQILDIDPIWFCILVVKATEIGLITPPVGLSVFVVKGVVGDNVPIETIFKGVAWFTVTEIVIIWILVAFPAISLTLPNLMFGD